MGAIIGFLFLLVAFIIFMVGLWPLSGIIMAILVCFWIGMAILTAND
jgi:uncharacterized membrane protein